MKKQAIQMVFPFIASALLSYLAYPFVTAWTNPDRLGQLFWLFPGVFFSSALCYGLDKNFKSLRFVVMSALIVIGWRAACYVSMRIYAIDTNSQEFLFVAGAAAGFIGALLTAIGISIYIRYINVLGLLIVISAGTVVGAVSLPAGFLFQNPEKQPFIFLFITYLSWQMVVGIVALKWLSSGRIVTARHCDVDDEGKNKICRSKDIADSFMTNEQKKLISMAKVAISQGRDRKAVEDMLEKMGVDPRFL